MVKYYTEKFAWIFFFYDTEEMSFKLRKMRTMNTHEIGFSNYKQSNSAQIAQKLFHGKTFELF